MEISEHGWTERLAPESADREAAVSELRRVLLKGVRNGLSGQPKTDESFIEDVVQTALIRILDRLDSFERRSAFTTWALAIALRVAFTELRREHWGNVSLEELTEKSGLGQVQVETPPNPEESAIRNSMITLMHELIRTKLTQRQRDALIADLNAMPQGEIARQMGITRNAVYKLTHDARKALRRALEASNYGVEQVRDILENQSR